MKQTKKSSSPGLARQRAAFYDREPISRLSASGLAAQMNRIVPYISRVTHFRDLFDIVPFLRTRRMRETIVDTETVSLLRSMTNDEAAYQTARDLMRLARIRGDHEMATLYTRRANRRKLSQDAMPLMVPRT